MQTSSPEPTGTPPAGANDTEMKNPPKKQTRMVKIVVKHPIRVMKGKDEHIVTEGQTVEVTEEEAREFCDKAFDIGHKGALFGNMSPDMPKQRIIRAVRAAS